MTRIYHRTNRNIAPMMIVVALLADNDQVPQAVKGGPISISPSSCRCLLLNMVHLQLLGDRHTTDFTLLQL